MTVRAIWVVIVGLGVAGCGGSDKDGSDGFRNAGSTIVFVSDRDNPRPKDEGFLEGIARLELYSIDSENAGKPNRLTSDEAPDIGPACSPDGRTIAFTHAIGERSGVYLMRLDGTGARRLTAPGTDYKHPSWSPDGGKLVLVRAGSKGSDLYVIGVENQDEHLLLSGPGDQLWPAWSPRGDQIAFLRQPDLEDSTNDIYLTNTKGTNTRRLLHDVSDGRLTWSPDGKELAFVRSVEGWEAIWIMNVVTRRLRKLTPAGLESPPQSQPAWSPDGRRIVFEETAGLAVVNRQGLNYEQLRLKPIMFPIVGGWAAYYDPTWCN